MGLTARGAHRLAYLDGWRGLAIVFVLAGHFALDPYLPGLSILGVDLFFVLSGRLMGDILIIRKMPLPRFFLRRFSRVYPALLVFVLLTTILWWQSPLGHGPLAAALALTFTLNYAMVFAHQVALLDHLWSLCVEEHAYTMLAAIAFVFRRRTVTCALLMSGVALLAMANAVVSAEVFNQKGFDIFWRTDVAIAPIFLSAAICIAMQQRSRPIPAWVAPVAFMAAILVKLTLVMSPTGFVLGAILLAIGVNALDSSHANFRSALSWRPLTQIGVWSFSLYLWQQPFYKMSYGQEWPATMVLFLAAIAAALLSFYLVEHPSRRRLNAHFDRQERVDDIPSPKHFLLRKSGAA